MNTTSCISDSLGTAPGCVLNPCINPDTSMPMLGLSCSIPNTDTTVPTKAPSTEGTSNVFLCLDERLDASLLFPLPPFTAASEDAFVEQSNKPWDRNEHEGRAERLPVPSSRSDSCGGCHSSIQTFPTKTEKQLLLPQPSKLSQAKAKEQPASAGSIPSAAFILRKFKLKRAPRAAKAEANSQTQKAEREHNSFPLLFFICHPYFGEWFVTF